MSDLKSPPNNHLEALKKDLKGFHSIRVNDQWRIIQVAQGLPESTTKLETKDVNTVYETLNRHSASKFGISVSWPSLANMSMSALLKG